MIDLKSVEIETDSSFLNIYKFNDTADKAVIKPIAGAYKAVLPCLLSLGL